ncbi:MAG: flagellar basal body P-ring protein FlgI [Pirellulales bacterium]|nr:flagellar basal body P-ring protein FlgI [Pirellulales bacterium]
MDRRLMIILLAALMCLAVLGAPRAVAATRISHICRVKGQEENTLQGIGLVIGLKGTGDGGQFLPTIRPLATALQLMRNPVGKGGPLELKDAKNVALVMVTATIPPTGARQGDKIDCTISSIGAAKSLAGGQLFLAPLQGPDIESERVFAFATGPISLDDAATPTTGKIHQGCRLEEDFFNPFTKDDRLTLVLDRNHANFELASDVAEAINSQLQIANNDGYLARAIDSVNVEVMIPADYRNDPVLFVSEVMRLPLLEVQTEARVVINERTGSIVVDGDVEIGPVVVTHKNVVVQTGAPPTGDRFVAVAPGLKRPEAKLQALLESLNAVKVPNEDIIEIIKGLDRTGKLHAKLIVE